MTQEIKDKLEQAADALFEHKGYSFTPCDYAKRKGFLQGAQTILENPVEWDLVKYEDHKKYYDALGVQNNELKFFINSLQSQLDKYSNALKRIDDVFGILEDDWEDSAIKMYEIAKEALKQEDTK